MTRPVATNAEVAFDSCSHRAEISVASSQSIAGIFSSKLYRILNTAPASSAGGSFENGSNNDCGCNCDRPNDSHTPTRSIRARLNTSLSRDLTPTHDQRKASIVEQLHRAAGMDAKVDDDGDSGSSSISGASSVACFNRRAIAQQPKWTRTSMATGTAVAVAAMVLRSQRAASFNHRAIALQPKLARRSMAKWRRR